MPGIVKKSATAIGVLGLSGIGVLAGPMAAQAVPVCAVVPSLPAPTMIAPGICEIRVSAVGTGTYAFPTSGIAKLSAVLIGGGGGGFDVDSIAGYGGQAGTVTYVDSVVLNPAGVAITVGAGGAAGDRNSGSAGFVGSPTAVGANSAPGGNGGQPGSAGTGNTDYSGGGAGGPATGPSEITPGPGLVIQSISGVDPTLFPSTGAAVDPVEYAPGGEGASGSPFPATTPTMAGAGGAGLIDGATSTPGINGLVILRYAPQEPVAVVVPNVPAPELAATGAEATQGAIAGLGLVSVGMAMFVLRRRFSREAH